MPRPDNRHCEELRPVAFTADIAPHAAGSVLVATGNTRVICAATLEDTVPPWMKEQKVSGGWLTAEYSMLPYSTLTRKPRDGARGRVDGRSVEIQRLIGRSLRAVLKLEALGPRTLNVDCDVLQADGGTRTASITGACLAVALAAARAVAAGTLKTSPLKELVAAVSVGVVNGEVLADLRYEEDRDAEVDMNLVMTASGRFVEVQGTGEETTFSREHLDAMLAIGASATERLIGLQREFLAAHNAA